jgi:methylglutaconyl-CoA hydratase
MTLPDEPSEVELRVEGKIGWLTLNRPAQLNAITLGMARSLVSISRRIETLVGSDELRVVVVRGAGKRAFCSGADLKQRADMDEAQLWEHASLIRGFVMYCREATAPVIAAIHGYCLGGGLEIAMGCDIRIATTDASLGFSEVTLGAFPGAGGAVLAPRIVGSAIARELLYTGRRVSGAEAYRLGLVNDATPAEEMFERASGMAGAIAANGPLAVRALKRLLNRGPDEPIEKALELSDALRRPLNLTSDYAEGLSAFAERRSPVFRGV